MELLSTGRVHGKWGFKSTNRAHLQYVRVFLCIHFFAATFLHDQLDSLWLLYFFVWMQVSGDLDKAKMPSFGDILLFVTWLLTGHMNILSSYTYVSHDERKRT